MFSKFFLDRPVLSWVIAIMVMAAGVLAIFFLPISQFTVSGHRSTFHPHHCLLPGGIGGNGGKHGYPDHRAEDDWP